MNEFTPLAPQNIRERIAAEIAASGNTPLTEAQTAGMLRISTVVAPVTRYIVIEQPMPWDAESHWETLWDVMDTDEDSFGYLPCIGLPRDEAEMRAAELNREAGQS